MRIMKKQANTMQIPFDEIVLEGETDGGASVTSLVRENSLHSCR
jgi:hypothetical protein